MAEPIGEPDCPRPDDCDMSDDCFAGTCDAQRKPHPGEAGRQERSLIAFLERFFDRGERPRNRPDPGE